MTAVDPVRMVAEHECTIRCSTADHAELIWLCGPDGAEELDRLAVAAGIVLQGLRRPGSTRGNKIHGPCPPQGPPARPAHLSARYRPWIVQWARQGPVTSQAATDAPDKIRAAVGPDEHDGLQLELFPSGATRPVLLSTRPRPRVARAAGQPPGTRQTPSPEADLPQETAGRRRAT